MGKKNQDGKDKDDVFIIGALVAAVFIILGPIVILLLWDKVGEAITFAASRIRYVEMLLFAVVFDSALLLLQKLGLVMDSSGRMSLDNFKSMMSQSGYFTRWLFLPAMVSLGLYAFLKSPREMYSKVHTMTSLAKQEAKIWPEIAPVANLGDMLVKQDPTKGVWASAMTEREFATQHKLITVDGDGKPAAKKEEARAIFASMLGSRWTSAQALPPHTKALFTCFAMRIGGDAAGCTEKLRLMSSSFAEKGIAGMDTSWVDGELKKHLKNALVQRAIEKHAYVYTVLATMLQIAKTDGVLASPMFIWVKTVDRKLWYTLNNVGRYAFHVDCAGIMAHWLFEKTVGLATPTPMVGKAVDGLDMALKEYKDDDSLERMFE